MKTFVETSVEYFNEAWAVIVVMAGILLLGIGLECGYRIGVHAEATNHRKYIESLNVGAMSADRTPLVGDVPDENCADGPCEATQN